MKHWGAVLVLFAVGCGAGERELRAKVDGAQAAEAEQRGRMQRLRADAATLVSDYEEVSNALRDAERTFFAARDLGDLAATDFAAAEAAYLEAERNWRWMTYVVLAAASYDVADEICAGVESTRDDRRRMGIVGDESICVDHSFAHALGGVNHPWNYVLLDCGANASYGAAFWSKLVDMPVEVLRGLAVSALARLRCGSVAAAWRR